MPDKPVEDQVPIPKPGSTDAGPYGDRWGAGPASTPYNRAGSIASDPASAPRPQEDARPPESKAAPKASDEDAAMRDKREQGWDSEGGAAPRADR